MADTTRTPLPVCPHCGHEFGHDDMHDAETDLYALAHDEGKDEIECPECNKRFWVQGGYRPHYTTATNEDDLSWLRSWIWMR